MVTQNQTESKVEITISINEQSLSKILEAFAQAIQPGPSADPAQAQPGVAPPQLDALQKSNTSLWHRVQALQKEISSLQAQLAKLAKAEPGSQAPSSQTENGPSDQAAKPAQAPGNGSEVQTVQPPCKSQAGQAQPEDKQGEAPSQVKPGTVQPLEEEKAERWAREHLAEWVDTPCKFAKAKGRTWRQMAENYGEKIEVKGKPCLPRAYLHALQDWDACKVWQKMKAKVALEVGKNGKDSANHLAAIAG